MLLSPTSHSFFPVKGLQVLREEVALPERSIAVSCWGLPPWLSETGGVSWGPLDPRWDVRVWRLLLSVMPTKPPAPHGCMSILPGVPTITGVQPTSPHHCPIGAAEISSAAAGKGSSAYFAGQQLQALSSRAAESQLRVERWELPILHPLLPAPICSPYTEFSCSVSRTERWHHSSQLTPRAGSAAAQRSCWKCLSLSGTGKFQSWQWCTCAHQVWYNEVKAT